MSQCTETAEAVGLQQTLESSRATLELVAHKRAAQSWLRPAAESEAGTEELYQLLEERVSEPSFAERLAAERRRQQATVVAAPQAGPPAAAAGAGSDSEELLLGRRGGWWEEVRPDGGVTTVVAESTGEFILVEREDVLDALSQFIAGVLATLPEARDLEPWQLQRAIAGTLKELRKGRVRRLVDWGRVVYRVGAVSYGAFSVFSNPWVAKAVLTALWTAVRFLGRMAF